MMIDNFVGLGNNHSLLENGCWGSVNQLCIFQQRKKLEKKSGNFPKLLWLCSVFVFCEKLAKLFANSFSFKNGHLPWKKVFQTLFCFKMQYIFFRWAPEKNGDRHSENCQRLFRWQFRYQTIVQLLAARPLGALVVYDSALIKKVPWLAACAAANNTTERIQLSFARTYVLTLIYVAKVSFESFTINLYRNLWKNFVGDFFLFLTFD